MRLPEVERGDSFRTRAIIRLVSAVTGVRLPDAARVAFYHSDFVGAALGEWTQLAMRGESSWTVAERELMAAMVATWNSCAFCVGAHSAIAVLGMDAEIVEACRADYRTAPISERLRETLRFLEKQTLDPAHLSADDARTAIAAGVSPGELTDAAAVGALFNIITRYANALDFAIPTGADFDKAARMLLKRGYS